MWAETYNKKPLKMELNMRKKFPPNKFIPFTILSIEHTTGSAILFKLETRTDCMKSSQKADLTDGVWLPFSQIHIDPKDDTFVWVAEWLCRKNNMIPKAYHTDEFETAKKWHRHEWKTSAQIFDRNRTAPERIKPSVGAIEIITKGV